MLCELLLDFAQMWLPWPILSTVVSGLSPISPKVTPLCLTKLSNTISIVLWQLPSKSAKLP